MASLVHTAPPGTGLAFDTEGDGPSFIALAFLSGHPMTGCQLTKAPDSCRDLRQMFLDLSEHVKYQSEHDTVEAQVHRMTCNQRMRMLHNMFKQDEDDNRERVRRMFPDVDFSKAQCCAPWKIHIKMAGDLNDGPCLMHVNLVLPWIVKSFGELESYYQEVGDLIQAVYADRSCYTDAFDFRDVSLNLVDKTDIRFE